MTARTWTVDEASHHAFAHLSGDVNPIHTDELAARRLPFGEVVVHGVHVVLRALDHWAAASPDFEPTKLSATFRQPVGIGRSLTAAWSEPTEHSHEIDIAVDADGIRAVDIRVAVATTTSSVASVQDAGQIQPSLTARLTYPVEWSIEELEGRHGTVRVGVDADAVVAMFPALTAAAGTVAARQLVALTTLVGMHAPGRHSMLSSLSVDIGRSGSGGSADELAYEVTLVDRRFSRVTIDVTAGSLTGSVVAFVRPAPVDQHIDTSGVRAGEFAGQRWLIMGGSRGLGAAAVRLLTAGGADVHHTHHRGVDEAGALSAATGSSTSQLDVLAHDFADSFGMADAAEWAPTHLGWFASPPIFVGARGAYSTALFDRFVTAYVDSFTTVVEHLAPRGLQGALWPSSEAVVGDVPGLAEYADAKRLGELRCADLGQSFPALTIAAPRLPRLLTDQTTSFVPVEFGDTATEILTALRATLQER